MGLLLIALLPIHLSRHHRTPRHMGKGIHLPRGLRTMGTMLPGPPPAGSTPPWIWATWYAFWAATPSPPAPGYPPPPVNYAFPGQSQSPPFGPPGLPVPPPHGHPLPPPPPPQPIHYSPGQGVFPGHIPPPGFPVYPPGYPPPQHDEAYSPYPNRRRENHRDERYAKHERGGRRGGRHSDRDRERHGYERDRPHHEHAYDRDHRGRGDRHGPKRRHHDRNIELSPRGGKFHQVPPRRSESVQSKNRLSASLSRQDSLHTSAQSTPGPSAILDHPQPLRRPEDATSNGKVSADPIDTETKTAAESDDRPVPDVSTEDKPTPNAQVKDQSAEPQANSQVHLAQDIGQQPEDEDEEDTPYEGFKYDEQTIFLEIDTTNKGDPIAEPLPIEWTDDIMLPPPYNAPGVKSAYVTPDNKDDFALGVRDTDKWAQYKYHIAFLDPENITTQSIDTYLTEVKKLQQKNEKRNKPGQQVNQRAKPQNRDHQSQRNHKDQHRKPENRKRRFEDYQGEPGADSLGRDRPADLSKPRHDYDAKRPKQMSPEPGEVSDSCSVQGGIGGEKSAVEGNGWTGWTRGPADILQRDYPLPGRQTPAKSQWYPDTDVHYQAQPPLRRYNTEGTVDGSYDSRHDYMTDSYTPRGHAREYDRHDRFRDGSEPRKESRGRSRSPGARRRFSDRLHSPESSIHHDGISSSNADKPSDSKLRKRNVSVVSSTGPEGNSREGHAASPSMPSSDRPSHRQGSQRPRAGRPVSRRSSLGNVSGPEEPGSPLTPLEAELLGLAGHDSSDSDAGGKSPQRKPEKLVPKMRRRRAQVDAAYRSVAENTIFGPYIIEYH
ncbi:uncharacterized protein PG986_005805 [Apiospora aurea]|uniref:Uncharacterized protein n=1 Tax=Apiospora aurea TaxID=335848 RepID=A0ABR1QIM3_9PEZI